MEELHGCVRHERSAFLSCFSSRPSQPSWTSASPVGHPRFILRRGLNETFPLSGDSGIRESNSARRSYFWFALQGSRTMAWYRIHLTEDERRIVNEERASHPNLLVRNKMLTIWLLHCGVTRQKAAEIVGVSRATVQRYVDAYCKGGLDGLRHSSVQKAVSELATFREIIRASFEEAPVCTIAEACDRIEKLTGIRRSPTQVRKFVKGLGLKWQRIRAIPVPPKKTLAEHVQDQAEFLDTQLKPKLDAAEAGQGHVFFVDAAHFVFGTFLCCLWSFTRIYVRAA